jgi:hypothetical protein
MRFRRRNLGPQAYPHLVSKSDPVSVLIDKARALLYPAAA